MDPPWSVEGASALAVAATAAAMIEEIVWGVSGFFAFAAVILALALIFLHLRNFTNKVQQRLIIRMIIMVPVYALDAWFALYFRSVAIYLNTLRCCYEAFVIYSFFTYLMYVAMPNGLSRGGGGARQRRLRGCPA